MSSWKSTFVEPDISGDLLELAKERGVPVTTVCEGDRFKFDDALCHVVSASSTSYDLNDASLVLKVQIDGINLLFTGDITQKRERILMKEGADVQCQLLHVPITVRERLVLQHLLMQRRQGSCHILRRMERLDTRIKTRFCVLMKQDSVSERICRAQYS